MEKEIYDKSSQGGEGINLQRFRLPLDEPILVSLSVMADAFETEVRKVSDRHASAIAKCNTAKAVPLRLVLPVPTLGDDVDGKSFHGRQGGGNFERHTRYSRVRPRVTSSKYGNFVQIATQPSLEWHVGCTEFASAERSVLGHISTTTVTVTQSTTPANRGGIFH